MIGITWSQTEHRERIDARVDASQHSQPFGGVSLQIRIVERRLITSVGFEQVVEHWHVLSPTLGPKWLWGSCDVPVPIGVGLSVRVRLR
jgi:hypothetical protein